MVLPLSVHVCGDVTVVVQHARRLVGKLTALKVAQLQLNTGYLQQDETNLHFSLSVAGIRS